MGPSNMARTLIAGGAQWAKNRAIHPKQFCTQGSSAGSGKVTTDQRRILVQNGGMHGIYKQRADPPSRIRSRANTHDWNLTDSWTGRIEAVSSNLWARC